MQWADESGIAYEEDTCGGAGHAYDPAHAYAPEHVPEPDTSASRPVRPVFVDSSGRRQRRVLRAARLLVIPAAGYVALLVSAMLGGPSISSPFVPLPRPTHPAAPRAITPDAPRTSHPAQNAHPAAPGPGSRPAAPGTPGPAGRTATAAATAATAATPSTAAGAPSVTAGPTAAPARTTPPASTATPAHTSKGRAVGSSHNPVK